MAHRRTVEGRPSATVYAVAALGRALAKDDAAVCRLIGNRLIHPESIDIAVAIEVEDGVLNPVLRQADGTDLAGLTKGYQEAFEEAKERRVSPEHSGHSVATVSNYGTFGITWATPVPLPDQTLILGVGAVRNVPDWNPKTKSWDRIRAAEVTLTFDHRVCDGGHAGRLLKQIVDLLEHPEKL
jgi:pyruvate/2-oxoglutarate dehydrogenase complex dihydrolipoamide acyltransferase (E2) component